MIKVYAWRQKTKGKNSWVNRLLEAQNTLHACQGEYVKNLERREITLASLKQQEPKRLSKNNCVSLWPEDSTVRWMKGMQLGLSLERGVPTNFSFLNAFISTLTLLGCDMNVDDQKRKKLYFIADEKYLLCTYAWVRMLLMLIVESSVILQY